MTVAICLACGETKHGAFARCKHCAYTPASGWEMSVSVICSDHYIPLDQLRQLGSDIQTDLRSRQPHDWNFDPGAITLITRQIEDPTWRDPLTLKKEAKQGLLTKQMNWHYSGPNGYRSQVITRGKELPKNDFDALTKEIGYDAFLNEAYIDGKPHASQVPKAVWYCMRDLMMCIERRGGGTSLAEAVLIANAEEFILTYLKEKHDVDMRSVVQRD